MGANCLLKVISHSLAVAVAIGGVNLLSLIITVCLLAPKSLENLNISAALKHQKWLWGYLWNIFNNRTKGPEMALTLALPKNDWLLVVLVPDYIFVCVCPRVSVLLKQIRKHKSTIYTWIPPSTFIKTKSSVVFISHENQGCSLHSSIDRPILTERRLAVNFQHLSQ